MQRSVKLAVLRRETAKKLSITEEELKELLPSRGSCFSNRANWAILEMKDDGLVERPKPGDTRPLTVLVERLRFIPGNGWEKFEDLWERLKQEREDLLMVSVVAFDVSFLLSVFSRSLYVAPKDPSTGKPIKAIWQKIDHLLSRLEKEKLKY